MKTLNAFLGAAFLAVPSLQHIAIRPPTPDKALTPNSSTAPKGCRLLASDKGFPADDVWLRAFPKAFKKLKGTEGPDFWIQPTTVEEIQTAVNFARERNVRLTVITTGHDFHGREDTRSGLRVDMSGFMGPTVFSNTWKCGDKLQPKTTAGKFVEDTIACKVPSERRNVGRSIPQREHEWHFFEKRDGQDCSTLVKKHLKRQTAAADIPKGYDMAKPWEYAVKTGFKMPQPVEYVPSHNEIKPEAGKAAYARISGGMYNELFFTQADKSGFMTLGAQHNGVSVLGGWMQAGGHNPFANRFGMQVDNIVELDVVTPDGKFQSVSECNNPELFWALRGGGGGTFGIVTGGVVKVYPTMPIVVTRFMVNTTKPYDPKLWDAVAYFLQNGAKLRDQYGLQGYFYVYPNGFHSVLHLPDKDATLENAKKVTEPLMAKMEELAGAKHIQPEYIQHKKYIDWYTDEMGDEDMEESGKQFRSWNDGAFGEGVPSMADVMMNPVLVLPFRIADAQREAKQAGNQKRDGAKQKIPLSQPSGRTYLDSRLLSDKHVNSVSLKVLAEAVNQTFPRFPGNHIRGFLYGGGAMAKPKGDAMGLLPQWRDMTYHYIVNAVPGSSRHDYNVLHLDKLFPDAGAYVNEASPGEPNWKQRFWGANYARLEQIKKKVDPENVLWCSPCVGADLFTYDDERICPNAKYPQAGPAPQTYRNDRSKAGIASLPGEPGIPNPLAPLIQQFMVNKTLPKDMPRSSYFKMAMGQGGSAGGKWSLGAGNTATGGADHAGMGGMGGMGHARLPGMTEEDVSIMENIGL